MRRTRRFAPPRRLNGLGVVAALIALALFASGCAVVKPWEKDLLARPDMQAEDDAHLASLRGHIAFSKEASLVGGSGAGGGCGCN